MEKSVLNRGFTAHSDRAAVTHQRQPSVSASLWRPWTGTSRAVTHTDPNLVKPCLQVVHPVKLFWPKSKCFDYLYQEAEQLLRTYPVQASICPCEASSSDEDSDEDSEEDEDPHKD